jgi:hypothetical protein
MPNVLIPQNYPDDFQIHTTFLRHGDVPADDCVPIFYADRTVVIDSIVYGVSEIDDTETVELVYATTPQATTGTSIQTAVSSLATLGMVTPTVNTANNEIPSGSWIIGKFSDGVDTAHVTIQIRFRSRLA